MEWGCRDDDFSGGGNGCRDEFHVITGIDSIFVHERSGFRTITPKSDSLAWNQATLVCRLSTLQLVQLQPSESGSSLAYALSPANCAYKLSTSLDSLYIFQYDPTQTDHKGKDLTDACRLTKRWNEDSINLTEINAWNNYSLDYTSSVNLFFEYNLIFFRKPTLGNQQFLVEFTLSDNTKITAVTRPFTLTE
jgi:hypothetical protein